jgi:hypothetical protein
MPSGLITAYYSAVYPGSHVATSDLLVRSAYLPTMWKFQYVSRDPVRVGVGFWAGIGELNFLGACSQSHSYFMFSM